MNKFDPDSMKFVGIVLGICLVFIIIVWHAFGYLPEKSSFKKTVDNEISIPVEEQRGDREIEEYSQEEQASREEVVSEGRENQEYRDYSENRGGIEVRESRENIQSESGRGMSAADYERMAREREIAHQDNMENRYEEISDSEEMNTREPLPVEQGLAGNELEQVLNNAKQARENRKFAAAISEYQKAISIATEPSLKADVYEEMALVYAGLKRYGSALAAAQKAYNLAPSSNREILLARLYYKTGDYEKANNRANNVLKRDFPVYD